MSEILQQKIIEWSYRKTYSSRLNCNYQRNFKVCHFHIQYAFNIVDYFFFNFYFSFSVFEIMGVLDLPDTFYPVHHNFSLVFKTSWRFYGAWDKKNTIIGMFNCYIHIRIEFKNASQNKTVCSQSVNNLAGVRTQ